jgi:hypothetical protein
MPQPSHVCGFLLALVFTGWALHQARITPSTFPSQEHRAVTAVTAPPVHQ